MRLDELARPSLPIFFARLALQLAEERGLDRATMLAGIPDIAGVLDSPTARCSVLQYGLLIHRLVGQGRFPGVGYEIGLRSTVTAAGLMGYGLMSCSTVGEAIRTGLKFVQLQTLTFGIEVRADDRTVSLELLDLFPSGPCRRQAIDGMLVSIASITRSILGAQAPELALSFCCEEPAYYRDFRARLPDTAFAQPRNALVFPARYWDAKLPAANPTTAQLVWAQCEQELALLGYVQDFLVRVCSQLSARDGKYPALADVAARLHVSPATLKRRLQHHQTSFQKLIEEAKYRDALRLMEETCLSISAISERLGYTEHANFTRAFRKWSGRSPRQHRTAALQAPEHKIRG